MLNIFCPKLPVCPKPLPPLSKSGLNLAKMWIFTSVIQDTNVIVGLQLVATGTNMRTVLCVQGKKLSLV